MFMQSLNDCLGYIAQLIVMMLGLGLAFMLLSFWIEDRPFAYTMIGKILSIFFSVVGSGILGILVYLMMHETRYAYNTFIMETIFSLFAIIAIYSRKLKKD